MKTKTYLFSLLIIFTVVYSSCTHFNELYKYNLSSKAVLFKNYINPQMSGVNICLNTEVLNDKIPFGIILADIGAGYLEEKVKEKLEKVIQPDSIVNIISSGMKDGLMTYYDISPVDSLSENPEFILETRLNKFTLRSGTAGVYAHIDTKVMIINRPTGATVWENDESSSIPIYDVMLFYPTPPLIRSTGSVVNAVRLLNMTEEEMKVAIDAAAKVVSKDQTERLRIDISEAAQK